MEPKEIIKLAAKKGLSGVAITDHDTIKGGLEGKKFETESVKVIVGCEFNTEQGEIIGLFLTKEIKSREIHEMIDEIHSQGGLVIVPHPFDKMRKTSLRNVNLYVKKIDAVEVFNARCILEKYNTKAMEFAKEHKISITGGSDAHYANEIGLAGIYTFGSLKNGILNNNLEIFHEKSPLSNHLKTKIHKLLN